MRTAATFQTGLSGSIPGGEHWGIIEGANEGFQNLRQQCGCFKPSSNRGDPLWFFRSSRDSCPSTSLSLGVLGPVFFCFELAMCMAKYWNWKQHWSWGLVVGGWGCWEGLKHTSALPLLQSWRTDVTAVTHIHSVASVLAADKQEVLRSILMCWNAEAAPFLRSIVEETRSFIWNEGFDLQVTVTRTTSRSCRCYECKRKRWSKVLRQLNSSFPDDFSLQAIFPCIHRHKSICFFSSNRNWAVMKALVGWLYIYIYTHYIGDHSNPL